MAGKRRSKRGKCREKKQEVRGSPRPGETAKPSDPTGYSENGESRLPGIGREAVPSIPEPPLDPSPLPASVDDLGARFLERATGKEPVPPISEELSAEEWALLPEAERVRLFRELDRTSARRDAYVESNLFENETEEKPEEQE